MFTGAVGETPKLERQPSLAAFVNPNVCKQCNGGWMSDLEVKVAPIADRLVEKDDAGSMSLTEIEILARWAGKTAVVLSYLTPNQEIVPAKMRHSLHPNSRMRPMLTFFYSRIKTDFTLEGGFMQLTYGDELGLVGTDELPGTRITLCIYNHMLTVDFPPILQGISYDLNESISDMFWPKRAAAGKKTLDAKLPAPIGDVLFEICNGIQVVFKTSELR